jgi:spermidine synthase
MKPEPRPPDQLPADPPLGLSLGAGEGGLWRASALIAPLAFVSGFCALAYQAAWLRNLRLVFGASTSASAATVAIFMAGLGVGSLLLGRRADRSERPLALYARLEVIIAVFAALSPLTVLLVREVYVGLGGSAALGPVGGTLVRLLLAALVLGPPTLAMGGTLPALAAELARRRDPGRLGTAWIYGWNTVGAVGGALAGTFLLLDAVGVRRTIWLAAALNLLVAVFARAMARTASAASASAGSSAGTSGGTQADTPAAASVRPPATDEGRAASVGQAAAPADGPSPVAPVTAAPAPAGPGARGRRRLVLASAALVGFAFFLMELVWYRMLAPILGGSTYTFGLVLALALAGIGLGGLAYALTARAGVPPLSALAATCALEAVCLLVPFALGDALAVFALELRGLQVFGFGGLAVGWALVLAVVVLPPALVAGYQFPLLLALLAEHDERAGRDVATAYAWNTAGGVSGAMAGGFGLMAALGAPTTWRWTGLALAALGAVLLLAVPRAWRRGGLVTGFLVLMAVVLASAAGPSAYWRHSAIGAGRATESFTSSADLRDEWHRMRRVVRWEREGIESSVALDSSSGYSLLINGKSDGHARTDAPTQVMAGLIGAALHPQPELALVIGLGTGSSAGWLAEVPGMRRVDVAELEPAVVAAAELCGPVAHDAVHHPKVRMLLGDGREWLLTTDERYDLVFSEPSNPYRAGVASLFSRELYRAARQRLSERGLFLQWLQAYEVDAPTVQLALATMAAEFRHVEVWRTYRGDLLLVAAEQPVAHDVPRIATRVAGEPWASALRVAWGVAGVEGFYAGYLAGPAVAAAVYAADPERLNTDDRPRLETSFARRVGSRQSFDPLELRRLAADLGASRPQSSAGELDWARVDEAAEALAPAFGLDPEELTGRSAARLAGDELARHLARRMVHAGDLAGAWRAWSAQEAWRDDPVAAAAEVEIWWPSDLVLAAESAAEVGHPAAAVLSARLAALDPTTADLVRGRARLRTGDFAGATEALSAAWRAYRRDPWPPPPTVQRALPLVREVARSSPEHAAVLFAALGEPFAVHLFDQARQALRLELVRLLPDAATACLGVLAPFEPHVPWDEGFLRFRSDCYRAAGHPLAARAAADLEELRGNLAVPLASLLRARHD